jgi:RNA polymerase sigma-70 factor (ECF subfamily)
VVEELLIARFRAGEPEAIREVYRRFAGPVTTVARSIVAQPDIVADVVQLTFVKAWQAADRFEGERDLAPWLYSIARRTAIDAVRHESRPTRGGHEPEVEVGHDGDTFEQTWIAFEVRRAIDALPADEREVVRRSHLLGETHTQIADALGVPVGTVKSRSGRAHKRLAHALAHLDANRTATGDVQGEQAPS